MSAWIYPIALAVISVLVAILERLFPKRDQKQLRPQLWSDFLHLFFNGHFLGIILAGLAGNYVLPTVDGWLSSAGILDKVYRNAASTWPVWVQIVVALFSIDLLQWIVHNLLHRVPFLWGSHKTHHSVVNGEMDWIVSFRFQWTEVVVYRTILYFPLVWFGFGMEALLFHAIFGTLIGHLNHANIDLSWGPLRYLLNSPNMHIWHHDYEGDEKTTVNFGVIFSCWDWIFGTAKLPDHDPPRIGFKGVEEFPTDFFGQMAWPLSKFTPNPILGAVVGAAIISVGWVAAQPRSLEAMATPMMGEAVAASQPSKVVAPASAYATDEAAAAAALTHFGMQAKADGMAMPESLVSISELAAALGAPKLVILDVRKVERYLEGHIPSAQQLDRPDYSGGEIPGLSRSTAELQTLMRRLGVSDDSVVVAYTDGGPEAIRLWWTLRTVAGYDIKLLDGGLQRWKYEGHGIAEGQGRARVAGDVVLPGGAPPTRWADVKKFMATHPGAQLIDTRSEEEFVGKKRHRNAKRAGRIPHAKRQEWLTMFRDRETDHRLKSAADLKTTLGDLITQPVVTYCQSGTRSSAVYFALLQAGANEERLMNYDGSWAEYSRLELAIAP